MSTSSKATAPTAREVAASIKALGGRLTALVDKLAAAGDAPVPADSARALAELAAAIRAAVEPTPPSATAAEKRDPHQPEDGWPRDMLVRMSYSRSGVAQRPVLHTPSAGGSLLPTGAQ